MTIITPARQRVSGVLLEGSQISCAGEACNHCSAFFPSQKHLPPEVVVKKFQQMGWEVNSSGHDYCSNCVARRRAKKKAKVGVQGAIQKTIQREIQSASAQNARRLMSGIGLVPDDVVELEHKNTRFKIVFRGLRTLSIGQLTAAEGELLEVFNAALLGSTIKNTVEQREENGRIVLEPVLIWYITMDVQKQQFTGNVVPLKVAAE